MKHLQSILLIIAFVLSVSSCSCNRDKESADDVIPTQAAVTADKDSEAYKTGYADARKMLAANYSSEELHDKLLDTRALISLIHRRHGMEEASNYQAGFTSAIRESGDTLATCLFGADEASAPKAGSKK